MPYKKILVAVDLTEEAQEVLNRAREVAQQNGAELSVIVVVKPINQVYSGFDVAALSADAALIELDAVRQAESRLAEHSKALNIPAKRTYVGRGSPAYEIRAMAEELARRSDRDGDAWPPRSWATARFHGDRRAAWLSVRRADGPHQVGRRVARARRFRGDGVGRPRSTLLDARRPKPASNG